MLARLSMPNMLEGIPSEVSMSEFIVWSMLFVCLSFIILFSFSAVDSLTAIVVVDGMNLYNIDYNLYLHRWSQGPGVGVSDGAEKLISRDKDYEKIAKFLGPQARDCLRTPT